LQSGGFVPRFLRLILCFAATAVFALRVDAQQDFWRDYAQSPGLFPDFWRPYKQQWVAPPAMSRGRVRPGREPGLQL
jgi:hypothetical protein